MKLSDVQRGSEPPVEELYLCKDHASSKVNRLFKNRGGKEIQDVKYFEAVDMLFLFRLGLLIRAYGRCSQLQRYEQYNLYGARRKNIKGTE